MKHQKIIYLDNAATMLMHSKVIAAMTYLEKEGYGNSGSPHALGEKARTILDEARTKLAHTIRAKPWEIIFTSGATESNNLALQGILNAIQQKNKRKIIISAIEHASVWEVVDTLKKEGAVVVESRVNRDGLINLEELERAIDKETAIVSVIHGHNEIGVIQNISAIGALCQKRGVLFHTDAAQSFGKIDIDVKKMNVDLLSASSHKIGGPIGIGLLYVRDGVELQPLFHGGGQERGLRGGTENVAGAFGFSTALEIMQNVNTKKIEQLRDMLIQKFELFGGQITGSREQRLWNNVHVSFPRIDAEQLVIWLSERGVMCSTKSACSTKERETNRILKALGMSRLEIHGSVRFTLSGTTTHQDIARVIKLVGQYLKI